MRVVKLVDSSVETCARVRQAVGPGCLMIYRWCLTEPEQDRLLVHPHDGALEWHERYADAMRAIHA